MAEVFSRHSSSLSQEREREIPFLGKTEGCVCWEGGNIKKREREKERKREREKERKREREKERKREREKEKKGEREKEKKRVFE